MSQSLFLEDQFLQLFNQLHFLGDELFRFGLALTEKFFYFLVDFGLNFIGVRLTHILNIRVSDSSYDV